MDMSAAIAHGDGKLTVERLPIPAPGPYQVLCRARYGATCAGTDSHIVLGNSPMSIPYPTILGHESVGEIVEVGPRVRNFRVGDRVTRIGAPALPDHGIHSTWGGFAQYGLATDQWARVYDGEAPYEAARNSVQQLLPHGIDMRDAALVINFRETLSYFTRMAPNASGKRVLIIGSGANGLCYANHAANAGAARVTLVGQSARAANGKAVGAGDYLDYKQDGIDERLRELEPRGYDILIDAVGHAGELDRYLPALAPGAHVGIYGIEGANAMRMNPLRARHSFTVYHGGYSENETHHEVTERMLCGHLRASDYCDTRHPTPLADIAGAYARLMRREAVKVLIDLE